MKFNYKPPTNFSLETKDIPPSFALYSSLDKLHVYKHVSRTGIIWERNHMDLRVSQEHTSNNLDLCSKNKKIKN